MLCDTHLLAVVEHAHHADGLGSQKRHGRYAFLHKNQHVEGVLIIAICLRQKPWGMTGGVNTGGWWCTHRSCGGR